jgi:hypothetical protein
MCSSPPMSPQPGRPASMSVPAAGLAASLCKQSDNPCNSTSHLHWLQIVINKYLPSYGGDSIAFGKTCQKSPDISVGTVGTATAYGLHGRGSIPSSARYFSLSTKFRPALGPTQYPIQIVLRALGKSAEDWS